VQPGAVLFFHFFDRKNSAPKTSDLGEFLLDFLQPFLPPAVSNFSFPAIAALKAKLLVQCLDFSDLGTETPNLFSKNLEVIHMLRIAHLEYFWTGSAETV